MNASGLGTVDLALLGALALLIGNYLIFMISALTDMWTYKTRQNALRSVTGLGSDVLPPATIIAPMYNEAACIVEATKSLLSLRYPRLDVLLVNDGSKDDTLDVLREAFRLEPAPMPRTADVDSQPVLGTYRSRSRENLWVVDKQNGGKADAVNAGIARVRTPLLAIVDADGVLEPDSLMRLAVPFMLDARTVATGGNIRILNGSDIDHGILRTLRMPSTWIERIQILEYMRAFLVTRRGWSALNMLMLISGAFGLYRREAVAELGGMDPETIGEDTDLTIRLHRHYRDAKVPYRITYVPDAVCWTEAPSTYEVLGKQRDRWHRGLTEILVKHRDMLFNPRYGRIGLVGMPYFLLVEWVGPLLETLGYALGIWAVVTGAINWQVAVLLMEVALLYGTAYSFAVVAIDESDTSPYTRWSDIGTLLLSGLVEHLGYRQRTVYYRLRGIWKYLKGDNSWGEMTRTGFSEPTSAPEIPPASPGERATDRPTLRNRESKRPGTRAPAAR